MKYFSILSAISICCMLFPVATFANSSFDGDISLGVIAIDSANNLNPNSSKRIIANLDSAADRELSTIPVILPNLRYTPDTKNSFHYFLSTRPPIEEVGGFALGFGIGFSVEDIADIGIGLLAAPFGEVWKNPYLVGIPRDDTENSKYGLYATFEEILSSGFELTLAYYHDDVDNDEIGDLFTELERDGQAFIANVGYSWRISDTFSLTPQFLYTYGDYDGDANSYDSYQFSLEARYRTGMWVFMPGISYGHTEYDDTHPIFERTRDEDEFSFDLIVQYIEPFGYENWAITGIAGYGEGDSNIDFFDTESIRAGIAIVYKF